MSKPAIPLEAGQMYHIWTHANGNENLYRSKENFRYFLDKYFQYIDPVAETFAYCLMPNHLHLMIRIRGEEDLLKYFFKKKKIYLQGLKDLGGSGIVSQQFSNLFNAYSKSYNTMYHRKGSLFIPNFKRKKIYSESSACALIVYIHRNPIHHRIVETLEEWPFSSWHEYVRGESLKINTSEGISWFGNKKTFINTHQGTLFPFGSPENSLRR